MADIEYAEAQPLVEAALARAEELKIPVSVAVVDRTREQVAFARQPGAPIFTAKVATAKAFTAASLSAPTHVTQQFTHSGGPFYGLEALGSGVVSTIPGGIPLLRDGRVIGAVGVSGGSADEDLDIAEAAAARFEEAAR
ncbi:heme-binding protein [Leucobacter weissii]|uniref:Heme-binding protein n=1 Tax=Leucobacter weissii TaxID=1983706 RepID=A0A939MPG6_9MICO|nr:heme-binding protein [Leucobacter weissii]MBO1902332.1 heme-binding protein [Leucobacter weissii]